MNIDRIFEQGVSKMSRAPRQMLTDAEIASAASASYGLMVKNLS